MRNLPSLYTGNALQGLFDVDAIDDDRRSILSAGVLNPAKVLLIKAVDFQGVCDVVDEGINRRIQEKCRDYVYAAGAWKLGLEQYAGDAVWLPLSTKAKFQRHKERAELLLWQRDLKRDFAPDLYPLLLGGKLGSTALFKLDYKLVDSGLRLYCDANKIPFMRLLSSDFKGRIVNVDHTFLVAANIGDGPSEKTMATLRNGRGARIAEFFFPGTNIAVMKPFLTHLHQQGFDPSCLNLDNVPTVADPLQCNLFQTYKECFPSLQYVTQDYFHAVQSFTETLPRQQDDWFFNNVTEPIRGYCRYYHTGKLNELKRRFENGDVQFKTTFRGTTYDYKRGQKVLAPEFERLKECGVLRKVFSSGPRCCVPLLWHENTYVQSELWKHFRKLRAAVFTSDGEQKLLNGKYPLGKHTESSLKRLFANFGKRLKNCNLSGITDPLLPQFEEFERGSNQMNLCRYLFGTGSNETYHALIGAIGGSSNQTVEAKHAHGLLAVVTFARRAEEKRGKYSIGHNDFSINVEANQHAQMSGVMAARRDQPALATAAKAAICSDFVLRKMNRPLQPIGSKAAARMVDPMKLSVRPGRKLASGIAKLAAAPTNGLALASPKRKLSSGGAPSQQSKRQKGYGGVSDNNRFPCTCGSPYQHKQACARRQNAAAVKRAFDAGLPYESPEVPKPCVGDKLACSGPQYTGILCFPHANARSHRWVPIGVQCPTCNKYDKFRSHDSAIALLKSKHAVVIETCGGH
jgi:hypothetical protein